MREIKIILYSIYEGYRRRGLLNLVKMVYVAITDEWVDRRRGVIIARYADPRIEAASFASSTYANYYQPIRRKPFMQLLQQLKPNKSLNFVDIGAGIGKAQLIAADYGFNNLRGVELIQSLCDCAQENFYKFGPLYSDKVFSISCGDALVFPLEVQDGVFLLNDPFSNEVFSLFVDRILQHFSTCKHEVVIIYKNNNLRHMLALDQLKQVSRYTEYNICGNFFQVYKLIPGN